MIHYFIRVDRKDPVNLISYDKEIILQIIKEQRKEIETLDDFIPWHYEIYDYYLKHVREFALLVAFTNVKLQNIIFEKIDQYSSLYTREINDILNEMPTFPSGLNVYENNKRLNFIISTHYYDNKISGDELNLKGGMKVAFLRMGESYYLGDVYISEQKS